MTLFFKNCPACDSIIYFSRKPGLDISLKNNSLCKKCSSQKRIQQSEGAYGFKKGKDNIMYGKPPTEETKKKIQETRSKRKHLYKNNTEEYKQRVSLQTSGKNNPMYGKTVYGIWLEKYGKEEADKRRELKRQKASKSLSGENGPMYGKSCPQKAGNGWSGWYKNWFFRSLRELSYMINEIEKNNLIWEKGELIRIKYIDDYGTKRTYCPDFLIENKRLVEIKPKRLQESKTVKTKTKAAENYCKINNLSFEIIDPKILSLEEVEILVEQSKIKLTDRTSKKLQEYQDKKSHELNTK